MKIREILAIGIVMLFGVTLLGGVHASVTTSGLPMPYGSRDLTHISNPNEDNVPDTNRFYGVRVDNDEWYTFIYNGEASHAGADCYYLNSNYSASDVDDNGKYLNDLTDINYYNFAKI
jgi:hypothetical protein